MTENKKLRSLLAEARALLLEARPTNDRCDCTQCKPIDVINDRIDAALAEPVSEYVAFVGPCSHGRDPWDRCETCGEGTELEAAVLALETARAEMDRICEEHAQRFRAGFMHLLDERDEARAEVERLRGEAAAWKAHSEAAEKFRQSAVAEAEAEVAYWKGEFSRLHEEHLPVAFAGAYQRGAEAMREAAAQYVEDADDGAPLKMLADDGIRALPVSEDKP